MAIDIRDEMYRHKNAMKGFITKMSPSLCKEDVDDIVQSAFLRILINPDIIRNKENIRAYLFTAAKWEFLDRYRAKNNSSDINCKLPENFIEKGGIPIGSTVDIEILNEAIKKVLSEDEYLLITMLYHQYSYREIGALFGWRTGTLHCKIFKIRKKIKKANILTPKFAYK